MQLMVENNKMKGPESFAFRLKAAMAEVGLTSDVQIKREMVRVFGIHQESVRKWLANASKPTHDKIMELADYAGVSAEWLLTGRGSMKPNASEDTPVRDQRASYVTIPFHTARAGAGSGAFNDDHTEIPGGLKFRAESLKRRRLEPANMLTVFVHGDSMEPTMDDGDLVMLDSSRISVIDGEVFGIVGPDGEIRLKRLFQMMDGRVRVASDNADKFTYPDEIVDSASNLTIIGRFVWLARFNPKIR